MTPWQSFYTPTVSQNHELQPAAVYAVLLVGLHLDLARCHKATLGLAGVYWLRYVISSRAEKSKALDQKHDGPEKLGNEKPTFSPHNILVPVVDTVMDIPA